jgi:hypothetical protein
MTLKPIVLSKVMQYLTDNIDFNKRVYYNELFNNIGSFNQTTKEEVLSAIRQVSNDSETPTGSWENHWEALLLAWLGINNKISAQKSGGCRGCG